MRIGILTGGGDVPGLNPCIKTVVNRAEDAGMTVTGIRHGWGGLLNYNPDDPDTDDVVVQRDVPEPPLLALRLQHERRPLVPAAVAIGALPVGPDRPLLQDRVLYQQVEPVGDQRTLPAGVHHDPGRHVFQSPILVLNADASGAVRRFAVARADR